MEKPRVEYKVTITRIKSATTLVSEWQKLRDLFPDERVNSRREDEASLNPQYGYVSVEKEVSRAVDILEQTLDELDVPAVIKAINKL